MKKVNVIRAKEKAEKKTKVAAYFRVSTGRDDHIPGRTEEALRIVYQVE